MHVRYLQNRTEQYRTVSITEACRKCLALARGIRHRLAVERKAFLELPCPSFCFVALIPTNRDPSSRGLLGDVRQVTCQIPWHPERAPARTPGARKGSWTNGKGARSLSSSRGRIGVVPLILTTRGPASKYSGTVDCAARYLIFAALLQSWPTISSAARTTFSIPFLQFFFFSIVFCSGVPYTPTAAASGSPLALNRLSSCKPFSCHRA